MLKHKARSADQGGKAMFVAKIMCEKNSLNSQADQMSTCLITPSALTGIVWWLGMRALEAHHCVYHRSLGLQRTFVWKHIPLLAFNDCLCTHAKSLRLCLTLCNPMN